VLLMSGMSNSAFADITSLRSTDERVVHLNNILKFAVFKRDRSLFAIGGPWNAAIDGGDPVVDPSCLIQTAIRHVKELVQVDLSNCTQWNRFLEVPMQLYPELSTKKYLLFYVLLKENDILLLDPHITQNGLNWMFCWIGGYLFLFLQLWSNQVAIRL
jgi:hypothetical protein